MGKDNSRESTIPRSGVSDLGHESFQSEKTAPYRPSNTLGSFAHAPENIPQQKLLDDANTVRGSDLDGVIGSRALFYLTRALFYTFLLFNHAYNIAIKLYTTYITK